MTKTKTTAILPLTKTKVEPCEFRSSHTCNNYCNCTFYTMSCIYFKFTCSCQQNLIVNCAYMYMYVHMQCTCTCVYKCTYIINIIRVPDTCTCIYMYNYTVIILPV